LFRKGHNAVNQRFSKNMIATWEKLNAVMGHVHISYGLTEEAEARKRL
jgi:hypothetical protein